MDEYQSGPEPVPAHIRSPRLAAAPRSRVRRVRAQGNGTILSIGIEGHAPVAVRSLGSVGADRAPGMGRELAGCYFAVVMTAPSMTTPAVTYFQNATRSLRASATISTFFMRPLFCCSRALNQRLSAEVG